MQLYFGMQILHLCVQIYSWNWKRYQIYAKFKLRNHNEIFSVRYADQLSIGDEVLVQENNELIPVKVNNVSSVAMQGNS